MATHTVTSPTEANQLSRLFGRQTFATGNFMRPGKKPGPKGNRKSTEERRALAVIMRRDGASLQTIGDKLDISPQAAGQLIKGYFAELNRTAAEAAEEVRELALLQIEGHHADIAMCLQALRVDAKNGMHEAILAIARLIDSRCKLLDRQAKLVGADAPTKSEVTGKDGSPLQGDLTPAMMRSFVEEQFGRVGPKDDAPAAEVPTPPTEG